MFHGVGFSAKQQCWLWCEAVNSATDVDSLKSKDAHTAFFGKLIRHARHLKIFGEMVVTLEHSPKSKVDNRGRLCIFMGYAKNAPVCTYRFLHIATKPIIESRDTQWFGKQYCEWSTATKSTDRIPLDDPVPGDDDYMDENQYKPLSATE